MLTRLEVDGFKNLHRLVVDFGPFTCIAGPNGVGKSNLFDAIRFLALLADHKLLDAARRVRGDDDNPTVPRDLFSHHGGETPRMQFAVEMIVPDVVTDSFGGTAKATSTFLRYELQLRYLPPHGTTRYGQIRLERESLRHITQGDAHKHLPWPHSAASFRDNLVQNARRTSAGFISTDGDEILTHQDGGARGNPRRSPAGRATATTIGGTQSVDDPTVFAAKQEMIGWRILGLEPSAMRRADKYWEISDTSSIRDDGSRLPGTLWRLGRTEDERREICAEVASKLSELLPIDEVRVVANDANQQYELQVREPRGTWLDARSISEGTLRFLALATMTVDPRSARLLCMEEPENGMHPLRIGSMLDLLTEMGVDPMDEVSDDNPLRQVIVNTHSPRLVQELEARNRSEDLLLAEAASIRLDGNVIRTVRLRHREDTWRAKTSPGVGQGVALAYLTVPRGAQVVLTP